MSNFELSMTPDLKKEAEAFFARWLRGNDFRMKAQGNWFTVSVYVGQLGLSSFDDDLLSRLVFLAHELGWRASVLGSAPRYIKVAISKRDRSDDISRCHPTLEDAVERFRKCDETRWTRILSDRRAARERGGR